MTAICELSGLELSSGRDHVIIKNGLILPTGQWYAPSAVINDALYCMVLHGIARYCIVLHGIALQMSPVIAFVIAVVLYVILMYFLFFCFYR